MQSFADADTIDTGFVRSFRELWAKPSADALVAQLHDDVVLRQPHLPDLIGKAAAHAEFRRLLQWLPMLHGVVLCAVERDDVVFIEWQMRFPAGKQMIVIAAVDRFVLKDNLVAERSVYFDQVDLMMAVLKNPSLWIGFLRYRFGKTPNAIAN